jgi:hypothetical protein
LQMVIRFCINYSKECVTPNHGYKVGVEFRLDEKSVDH